MADSTASRRGRKSAVPFSRHPRGYWCKRVRGTLHYFGRIVDDPDGKAALEEWLRVKDDLMAGRKPRPKDDGRLTVEFLCNAFLTAKFRKLQSAEISPRTFADFKSAATRMARVLGKTRPVDDLAADDFAELRADIAKTRNPESVGNEVNRIRCVFQWGIDNHHIEKQIRYGSEFNRPAKRILRKLRAARERKFLEASEIRAMIDGANVQLRAMILLAVNAGFGNSDCANVPISAFNLDTGWLDYPRPKTGIDRRVPLWPETIAAVKAWLAVRPEPKDKAAHGGLLFVTMKTRSTWAHDQRVAASGEVDHDAVAKACLRASDNPISKETRKLLNGLGIKRKGVSFYSLRHVFETIGGRSRDQVAVDAIMGHCDDSMSAVYREGVDDDRLQAVVQTVHAWLYAGTKQGDGTAAGDAAKPPETQP